MILCHTTSSLQYPLFSVQPFVMHWLSMHKQQDRKEGSWRPLRALGRQDPFDSSCRTSTFIHWIPCLPSFIREEKCLQDYIRTVRTPDKSVQQQESPYFSTKLFDMNRMKEMLGGQHALKTTWTTKKNTHCSAAHVYVLQFADSDLWCMQVQVWRLSRLQNPLKMCSTQHALQHELYNISSHWSIVGRPEMRDYAGKIAGGTNCLRHSGQLCCSAETGSIHEDSPSSWLLVHPLLKLLPMDHHQHDHSLLSVSPEGKAVIISQGSCPIGLPSLDNSHLCFSKDLLWITEETRHYIDKLLVFLACLHASHHLSRGKQVSQQECRKWDELTETTERISFA